MFAVNDEIRGHSDRQREGPNHVLDDAVRSSLRKLPCSSQCSDRLGVQSGQFCDLLATLLDAQFVEAFQAAVFDWHRDSPRCHFQRPI